jgi:hypothetical protein
VYGEGLKFHGVSEGTVVDGDRILASPTRNRCKLSSGKSPRTSLEGLAGTSMRMRLGWDFSHK